MQLDEVPKQTVFFENFTEKKSSKRSQARLLELGRNLQG